MNPSPRDPAASPCPDPETLARFMDGDLGEPERAPLEDHLAGCTDCLETVATSARALLALRKDRDLETRIAGPGRLVRRLAAAASFLFLAGAGWLALRDVPTPTDPLPVAPGPGPEIQRVAALPAVQGPGPDAVNSASGLELAGGFIAASNDSAVSSLCVQADGDTLRWALLRGSIFVELGAKSPPVRVVTPHATVTIPRGEVRVLVSPAQTDVLVKTGVANVEGSDGGGTLALAKGQAAATASKHIPEYVVRPTRDPAPPWVEAARARHLIEVVTSSLPLPSGSPAQEAPGANP